MGVMILAPTADIPPSSTQAEMGQSAPKWLALAGLFLSKSGRGVGGRQVNQAGMAHQGKWSEGLDIRKLRSKIWSGSSRPIEGEQVAFLSPFYGPASGNRPAEYGYRPSRLRAEIRERRANRRVRSAAGNAFACRVSISHDMPSGLNVTFPMCAAGFF
jgi:hypothetical protein